MKFDSVYFLFKKDTSNYDNFYFLKNSISYLQNDKCIFYSSEYILASDIFYFKRLNISKRLLFMIETDKNSVNNLYIPDIGFNLILLSLGTPCPNFIMNLKSEKIINNMIWSFKYNNKYSGEFIIGGGFHDYNQIIYSQSKYRTIYLSQNYSINFNSIYSQKNMIKDKFNITEGKININSGFIIGTKEYKEYIDKTFFNELISKKICQLDLVRYSLNYAKNKNDKNNNEYYIYSCHINYFIGNPSDRYPTYSYYDSFPKLVFSSKDLEYNFEIINNDLFEFISDKNYDSSKYYFLIIFPKNNQKEKELWSLGEPFFKKYPFAIDPDAKTIGFYIGKEKNNKINETNKNENNDKYIMQK